MNQQHATATTATASTAGWATHAGLQQALDAWLAREDVLAAAVEDGSVVNIAHLVDPAHGAPGPEPEAMIRRAFQRWTTTWEGVLHNRLELGDDGAEAVLAAQVLAAEVRAPEWRAIQRFEGSAVMTDLVTRQRQRVARAAGLDAAELGRAFARAESRTVSVVPVRPRVRRLRTLRRTILARRAV